MGAAACAAARSVGYVGAGTVEFLLDREGKFHFMEMNTRLQVEHPVTEMITGLDLVEWQLRVARGEPLPQQQQIEMSGHAIEARLYAEDAERGFLPQTGRLLRWRPSCLARTDHALADGLAITADYDPLLAKVIVHGATREEARHRLIAALRDTVVLGLTSNKAFLLGCLEHPEFTAGRADTDFIAAHFCDQVDIPPAAAALAAAALLLLAQARARLPQPWLANWHSAGLARSHFTLNIGKLALVPLDATHYRIEYAQGSFEVEQIARDADAIHLAIAGIRQRIDYVMENEQRLHLDIAGRNVVVEDLSRLPPQAFSAAGSSLVTPPMNGRIVALHVSEGQAVERGAALLTLESMKMEHVLNAACAGIVSGLCVRVGDQVAPGQRLALIQDAKTGDRE
jgi:geranyl-CoA carboxylase alpha subunit